MAETYKVVKESDIFGFLKLDKLIDKPTIEVNAPGALNNLVRLGYLQEVQNISEPKEQIKFRAYNKITKDILNWQQLIDLRLSLEAIEVTNKFNGYTSLEWLPYTGKDDDNGVSIYLGDILEVFLVSGMFSNGANKILTAVIRDKTNTGYAPFTKLIGQTVSYKVVGNIYKSRELLSSLVTPEDL